MNLQAINRLRTLRVAIVHYWFVRRRGGERVVETIASLFPGADLYFVVADPGQFPDSLRNRTIRTSFVQNLPGSLRWHRHFIPLYPLALEQFDFSGYDLVFSSESGPAKGIVTGARTCHICYCHSPMRYLWDYYHRYRNSSGFGRITRLIFSAAAHYLRVWDLASASRVDYFVANSETTAARIRKHYRRVAEVIFPPVDAHRTQVPVEARDHYLVVSHLADYKRVDLAIEACLALGRRLRIVGDGEQYHRLKRLARGNVEFLGSLPDDEVRMEYGSCRALLFPGEEDFGMVPVEAMAAGRPVIAFGRGGATESVIGMGHGCPPEHSTGLFFGEQTVASLEDAIQRFEAVEQRFRPEFIRRHAERFGAAQFGERLLAFAAAAFAEFERRGRQAPVSIEDDLEAEDPAPGGNATAVVAR
jgi:glycosyltransferase involved in cell wall biosynthesis